MARTGRRPGPTDTRSDIVAAARRLFAEKGYDGTTIRGIARDAGVDASLVHHFFGTKERVFVAAMELPFNPSEVLPHVFEGDPERLGERVTRFFFRVWGEPRSRAPFIGMLRSATTNDQAAAVFREFMARVLLDRAAEATGVPRARVGMAASQLLGLALLRYVIGVEPLASADEESVVALVAPTIQRYLTADQSTS